MSNVAIKKSGKRGYIKYKDSSKMSIDGSIGALYKKNFADSEIKAIIKEIENVQFEYEDLIKKLSIIDDQESVIHTIFRSFKRIDKSECKLTR